MPAATIFWITQPFLVAQRNWKLWNTINLLLLSKIYILCISYHDQKTFLIDERKHSNISIMKFYNELLRERICAQICLTWWMWCLNSRGKECARTIFWPVWCERKKFPSHTILSPIVTYLSKWRLLSLLSSQYGFWLPVSRKTDYFDIWY